MLVTHGHHFLALRAALTSCREVRSDGSPRSALSVVLFRILFGNMDEDTR